MLWEGAANPDRAKTEPEAPGLKRDDRQLRRYLLCNFTCNRWIV
jgi:hypothetical protein